MEVVGGSIPSVGFTPGSSEDRAVGFDPTSAAGSTPAQEILWRRSSEEKSAALSRLRSRVQVPSSPLIPIITIEGD